MDGEIEYLKGRFAILEHIVLIGLGVLGPTALQTVVTAVKGIDLDAVPRRRGTSTAAYRRGMEQQLKGFVTLCEKALRDDEG